MSTPEIAVALVPELNVDLLEMNVDFWSCLGEISDLSRIAGDDVQEWAMRSLASVGQNVLTCGRCQCLRGSETEDLVVGVLIYVWVD